MTAVYAESPPKPCDYFDIISGTSTGGLIAIMLGRLRMTVDDCINAYASLSESVFEKNNRRPTTGFLKHLERDSKWQQQQQGQYASISNDFMTKYAFEDYATPIVLGHRIMVAPKASAVVPGHADSELVTIHADHTSMVHYPSKRDVGYVAVSEHLQIMVTDAIAHFSDPLELLGIATGPMLSFRAVSGAVGLTISLVNVPGITSTIIESSTIAYLDIFMDGFRFAWIAGDSSSPSLVSHQPPLTCPSLISFFPVDCVEVFDIHIDATLEVKKQEPAVEGKKAEPLLRGQNFG
ncbi:hypothetical protein QBC36DRAFT_382447 [Triangularia setosa]|uniref:PNPLA domain-containing protein n=1 Tax=Triangularia setosa TaxID=2587417 RepID=A0AAN6VXN4_9PEZI|nr:hypothetical protein QBC36DRAFT_382447 [Podospora setosa]